MSRGFVLGVLFALAATPSFAMDVTSTNVADGASFPVNEICSRYGGGNISPALAWSGVPAEAKSLAVTMYDPDAHGGWWHWLVLNLPTNTTSLVQRAGAKGAAMPGRQHGNSNGNENYDGPCPPAGSGVHHYQITIWALDVPTADVDVNMEPGDVGAYLTKHALTTARITPVYQK
jgi:Raf kinase inhibitor-like YbhB/YbcL family protein